MVPKHYVIVLIENHCWYTESDNKQVENLFQSSPVDSRLDSMTFDNLDAHTNLAESVLQNDKRD